MKGPRFRRSSARNRHALRTGRAVRHTHDDRRHGVLDLFIVTNSSTARLPGSIRASTTFSRASYR
jgi:hypothetical protein